MMRAAATVATRHSSSRSISLSTAGAGRSHQRSFYAGISQHLPLPNHKNGDDDNTPQLSLPQRQIQLQQPNNHYHLYNRVQNYHTTHPAERGAAIVLGLGAVAMTAKAGQYTIRAYEEWKASQPEEPPVDETTKDNSSFQSKDDSKSEEKTEEKKKSKDEKRENIFAKLFNVGVGSKYYEGGFEDKMTRREAALILGVRESSTPKRIKEAHRKLLILNHPDTGGSTYLSGKINEAKELLLKGKVM